MAQQQQNTAIDQVLELLTEQGADGLAEAIRILLNAAMLFERERFLNAPPYERTQQRRILLWLAEYWDQLEAQARQGDQQYADF